MFKNLLIKKKNIDKRIRSEILKTRLELQKQHDKELTRINTAHLKTRIEFEQIMEQEVKVIEKNLKTIHNNKISELNEEIKYLKEQIRFAQDFWRIFSKDQNELYNIATRLESKAISAIEEEKAEFERKLSTKSQVLKTIDYEKEKLDMIFLRMKKAENKSVRLLSMLEED